MLSLNHRTSRPTLQMLTHSVLIVLKIFALIMLTVAVLTPPLLRVRKYSLCNWYTYDNHNTVCGASSGDSRTYEVPVVVFLIAAAALCHIIGALQEL